MGKLVRLLVTLTSCGIAVYLWAPISSHLFTADDVIQPPEQKVTAAVAPTETARQATKVPAPIRIERANIDPRQVPGQWTTVTIAGDEDRPAPRSATSSTPGNRLSSAKPGDDGARAQLVRDIQSELRRVGCYDGELHGWWSSATKRAMKAFTDRVNASLPVDEGDYILLSLVRGHKGLACGKGCPAGQVTTSEGCVPRAIFAQRSKGGEQKLTASTAEAGPAGHVQLQAAREPLPGRMAVGATAETALEEARRQGELPHGTLKTPGADEGPASGAATLPSTQDGDARSRHARSEPRAERRSAKPTRKVSTRQIMATIQLNAP